MRARSALGSAAARSRGTLVATLALTVPALALFAAHGAVAAWQQGGDAHAVLTRLFGPTFFAVLPVYMVWALAQQALLQFYLLGRVRALLPSAPPLVLSVINGVLFGAVHLPDAEVVALTVAGGTIWSQIYQRDRVLRVRGNVDGAGSLAVAVATPRVRNYLASCDRRLRPQRCVSFGKRAVDEEYRLTAAAETTAPLTVWMLHQISRVAARLRK